MIYNDRVTIKITQTIKSDGPLGEYKSIVKDLVVPCQRGSLTHNEQMGLFGSYNLSSFKLHLQGHYEGFDEVKYQGKIRQVRGLRFHRNSTVVYV